MVSKKKVVKKKSVVKKKAAKNKGGNRRKWTPDARARFIELLGDMPNVSRAARLTGFSRSRMYELKNEDPGFSEEWDAAIEVGCDRLEEKAWQRGADGIESPVYFMGKQVGTEKVYSDLLMVKLLEAHRPDKYRKHVKQEVHVFNHEAALDELE